MTIEIDYAILWDGEIPELKLFTWMNEKLAYKPRFRKFYLVRVNSPWKRAYISNRRKQK